ncbi:MAG: hypothetical protein GAK30_01394 [Paracidovorax wautersii]|uniref:PsiF repeat-containing protein n=1 Tax=Paracidovorax wautersii TaxID=1177982 RepID=A0A7V8FPY9_9BURK|nr:MAG: hypothetical protein GAK30_01394 [Paracidovorax wautersii]
MPYRLDHLAPTPATGRRPRLKSLARVFAAAMTLVAAGALAGVQTAQASSPPTTAGHAAASKAKSKTSRAAKVRLLKDRGESASERTQRLRRECKGRPNAGACQGHAS